jgi:predicted metal-dependent hydrolase
MNNQKQKIRTISAKALFKYFPKTKEDKPYAIYLINKALCRYVIKQEEDMEECPVFYQFYKEIDKRNGKNGTFEITGTTLLDKLVVMDFDNIFLFDDKSKDATTNNNGKGYWELLQECAKDIIENGFDIYAEEADTPVHMVAFDKSGNMSRKSRISFIDATYYDALNERLNLGMDFKIIQIQESKYYAYRGLYLSSAKRIENEELTITPETLVVIQDERKDPKNPDKSITGYNYEKANYISAKENKEAIGQNGKIWDVDEQGEEKVLYVDTPFDGVGFVDPSYASIINESLGTEGATSFQIRLPFAKGMLHRVDVRGFLDEYNTNRSGDTHTYVDAFGIKRDLGKARIFITESMFKAKKWIVEYLKSTGNEDMDPMAFYCDMLKKYDHALYVSGTNLPYGHSKYVHLSYQTINTLDFSKEQFNHILDRHKSFIKNPIEYLNSFDLEASDDGDIVDSEEGRIDYRIPNWRRALNKNVLFSEDIYIKHELKNTQKGLLTKLATGKILVEGQTRYLCRDLLPLLVSLVETPPDFFPKYLYYRFYLPTDGVDANADALELDFNSYYAFFRNPHLSRNEQYIMQRFCDTDEATYKGRNAYKYYMYSREIYDKYFGSLTGIVMVPRHSVLPLCLGGADFDGDLVSIVYNQDVVDAVASGVFVKAKTKLFGEVQMRNLPVIEIPSTLSEKTSIKEHVPYEHIKNTFSNRIGQISDAAISIGQMEYGHVLITDSQSKTEAREQSVENESIEEKYSKPSCAMCTILTGLEIDAAKNGEHPNLDIILGNDIEKCSYISFLHKFKKLRGEANYSFNNLKVESKENGGKKYIEVTAKDCSTVVKFYPPVFGTFINELPLAFYDAFSYYAKGENGKKTEKSQEESVFSYADNKQEEALEIEEFKSKCQNLFDYYFFYSKTLMHILSSEKNKGFYAIENLERKLYQAYDEEEAVRIQRTVVPRLMAHLKTYINENNSVADIKDRINDQKWLLVPMERRAAVLEDIIAGGFTADILDNEEKEVLFNFRNRGYINLWLVLSIIEGPKISTFDEILSRDIRSNIKAKDEKLEEKLKEYLRAYYDNNATDALGKIYAACLKALGGIMNKSGLSEQNIIAALYEISATSLDNRKFFWDLIGWTKCL